MLKTESRYVNRVHLDLKFQISHLYQYPALRNKNDHLDLLLESIWTWSFKFCIFIIFQYENLTNTHKKAIIVGNFMKSGNFNSEYIIHGYDEFQPSPFKPEIDHS